MQTVRQIAKEIVAREGGFVDDLDDPGDATNFGVTIHTLRGLGLDLTGDGLVDVSDVRSLTRKHAIEIFIKHYFERPGLDRIPSILQPAVFDMYVNAGAHSVRILQKLLNEMGFAIAIDGVIGSQTSNASEKAARRGADLLRDAYGIARRNYYFRLADRRPASRKFARTNSGQKGGWIKRAEEFISPKYHLSTAEFRDRTAAWD